MKVDGIDPAGRKAFETDKGRLSGQIKGGYREEQAAGRQAEKESMGSEENPLTPTTDE